MNSTMAMRSPDNIGEIRRFVSYGMLCVINLTSYEIRTLEDHAKMQDCCYRGVIATSFPASRNIQ